jgi:hypothetical protein
MGHQRLGDVPKTQKWANVVAKVAGVGGREGPQADGIPIDSIHDIAAETLNATEAGLLKSIDDPGLRYTFYLLSQIVLAAREPDWQASLSRLGIRLSSDSSLFDLTSEIQFAIDDHLSSRGKATDISEMAQKAAGEAIARLAEAKANTLFGSGSEEVQDALRELSTKAGFARLGQRFFGGFMARFLNFYLSRITAGQVGGPSLRQVGDLTRLNEALVKHCHQSALIVRDFCGDWYSKTEFQKGIDLDNTSSFMAVALKKLKAELQKQREGE